MRAKDMQTGVLYAYQRPGRDSTPVPVVLLSLDFFYMRMRGHHLSDGDKAFTKAREGTARTPSTARYADSWSGYLAVSNMSPITTAVRKDPAVRADPQALLNVTIDDVTTIGHRQIRHDIPNHPGVFAFVVDPRHLVGAWEEVWEKYQAATELADDLRRIENERRDSVIAKQTAAIARLADLNLPGALPKPSGNGALYSEREATSITLTVTQFEALLGLVPDDAKIPGADDGDWEYPGGEGRRG